MMIQIKQITFIKEKKHQDGIDPFSRENKDFLVEKDNLLFGYYNYLSI